MRIDGGVPTLRQTLMAALSMPTAEQEGFAVTGPVAPVAAPAAAGASATMTAATSVAMLVALAGVDPAAERRRRIARQADEGLTLLERLRDAMAAGRPAPERIAEMRAWVEGFSPPDDPVLAPIAREIELRVRVELARYDVAV